MHGIIVYPDLLCYHCLTSSDELTWLILPRIFALEMVPGLSDVFICIWGSLRNGSQNAAAYLQPTRQIHVKVSMLALGSP